MYRAGRSAVADMRYTAGRDSGGAFGGMAQVSCGVSVTADSFIGAEKAHHTEPCIRATHCVTLNSRNLGPSNSICHHCSRRGDKQPFFTHFHSLSLISSSTKCAVGITKRLKSDTVRNRQNSLPANRTEASGEFNIFAVERIALSSLKSAQELYVAHPPVKS